MRFRFGLPLFQTIAMLFILWAPWAPGAHKLNVVFVDGREFKSWTVLPDPDVFDSVNWAQGVNLPTLLAAIPIDLVVDVVRKKLTIPDPRMRFFLFWSLGLLVWYLVGRFVEDIVMWRQTGILPRSRLADLVFAVEAELVAILGAPVSILGHSGEFPVLNWWSAIWFVIGSAILAVRRLQVFRYRRRPAVS